MDCVKVEQQFVDKRLSGAHVSQNSRIRLGERCGKVLSQEFVK